jgi:hypothetical protein
MRGSHHNEYLPETAKRMVAALVGCINRPGLPDLVERLLAHPCMAAARRELLQRTPVENGLTRLPGWQRPPAWDLASASPREEAFAAVFMFALVECSQARSIGTRKDAEELAGRYFEAAHICRQVACERPAETQELVRVADVIDRHTRWQFERLLKSPYIIGVRSSGTRNKLRYGHRSEDDDKARAYGRALAAQIHAIYGVFLYGTVAKIVTVALQTSRPVTRRDVINWCADLAVDGCAN